MNELIPGRHNPRHGAAPDQALPRLNKGAASAVPMADTTASTVDELARELYRIHDEFEGDCMSCYLGHEVHEPFPCPTIRAFEKWREGLR